MKVVIATLCSLNVDIQKALKSNLYNCVISGKEAQTSAARNSSNMEVPVIQLGKKTANGFPGTLSNFVQSKERAVLAEKCLFVSIVSKVVSIYSLLNLHASNSTYPPMMKC